MFPALWVIDLLPTMNGGTCEELFELHQYHPRLQNLSYCLKPPTRDVVFDFHCCGMSMTYQHHDVPRGAAGPNINFAAILLRSNLDLRRRTIPRGTPISKNLSATDRIWSPKMYGFVMFCLKIDEHQIKLGNLSHGLSSNSPSNSNLLGGLPFFRHSQPFLN